MTSVIPLELFGIGVGLELVAMAVVLGFRPYYDGIRYAWHVPVSFFMVGSGLLLVVTEIAVVGLLDNPVQLTFLGYLIIGIGGILAFTRLWTNYEEFGCQEAPA